MKKIAEALTNEKEFMRLYAALASGACPALASGLGSIHRAHAISAAYGLAGTPVVVICSDENEVKRTAGDIEGMTGVVPHIIVPRELTLYSVESASRQSEHQRIRKVVGTGGQADTLDS